MECIVLASGSKGNCTYLEIGNEKILIDCGISYKQTKDRLKEFNKTLDGLAKIFITHEHSDHVAHMEMLAKNHDFDIYLSEGTYKNLNKKIKWKIDSYRFKTMIPEEVFLCEGYSVLPFNVYHDALDPFGYRFIEKGKSLVYITDTGYFPQRKYDLIRNAEAYIIESNHEVEMLLESERPWLLKRRILDDKGHLSNEDSANLLLNVAGDKTKYIILAHLSEDCNLPICAREAYQNVFDEQGVDLKSYQLIIAKQHYPTESIRVE